MKAEEVLPSSGLSIFRKHDEKPCKNDGFKPKLVILALYHLSITSPTVNLKTTEANAILRGREAKQEKQKYY